MAEWNLFLDDIRDPLPMFLGELAYTKEWKVARSFDEAVKMVLALGMPEHIAFDHDLGWDTLPLIPGSMLVAAPEEGKELPSGYDFAKWLVDSDMDGVVYLPEDISWTIHSSNPVGAANINGILSSYLKHKYNKAQT